MNTEIRYELSPDQLDRVSGGRAGDGPDLTLESTLVIGGMLAAAFIPGAGVVGTAAAAVGNYLIDKKV